MDLILAQETYTEMKGGFKLLQPMQLTYMSPIWEMGWELQNIPIYSYGCVNDTPKMKTVQHKHYIKFLNILKKQIFFNWPQDHVQIFP